MKKLSELVGSWSTSRENAVVNFSLGHPYISFVSPCFKLKFSMLNVKANMLPNENKFTFEQYIDKCSVLINT